MRSWPAQVDTVGFWQQVFLRNSSAVGRTSEYGGGAQTQPMRDSDAAVNFDRDSSASIDVERESSAITETIVERASEVS